MICFAEADPLGGWMQVILQTGALGLLAYIVIRLFPQLSKDQQEERNRRDATFASVCVTMQKGFEERSAILAKVIESQPVRMDEALGRHATAIIQQLQQLRERVGPFSEKLDIMIDEIRVMALMLKEWPSDPQKLCQAKEVLTQAEQVLAVASHATRRSLVPKKTDT